MLSDRVVIKVMVATVIVYTILLAMTMSGVL